MSEGQMRSKENIPGNTALKTTLLVPLALVVILLSLFSSCSSRSREEALFQKSMTALDQGLDGAAVEYLTQLLVRYPEGALVEEALYQRGIIYQVYQSRYQDAVSDYRELLDRFPGGKRSMESRLALAEIFGQKLDNCQLAIAQYQKLISDFDSVVDDDKYQFRIAACYFELLNFDQSLLEYRSLIEQYPASPLVENAYFQIASVLQTQGRVKEAEKAWRTFMARYPDGKLITNARFGLAATLEDEEKLKEALDLYQDLFDEYDNKEAISWRIERVKDRLKARKR